MSPEIFWLVDTLLCCIAKITTLQVYIHGGMRSHHAAHLIFICPSSYLYILYRGFVVALLTNPGSGTSLCSLVQHNIHHVIWFFQRNTRHTVKMPLSPMYRKHARLKEIMLLIQVFRGRKYEINSNLGLLRLLPVLYNWGCKEGL